MQFSHVIELPLEPEVAQCLLPRAPAPAPKPATKADAAGDDETASTIVAADIASADEGPAAKPATTVSVAPSSSALPATLTAASLGARYRRLVV